MNGFFITGTDTDVGKSVACAWATLHLKGEYWKPVQAGLRDETFNGLPETDPQFVQRIGGLDNDRIIPCRYELAQPLSPHEAARRDGISIKLSDFALPTSPRPLIIEGAGGVLVPLNEHDLMVDLMVAFKLPVIVVARTGLGTINHTLLTLQALKASGLTIAGVILNGDPNVANKAAIQHYGQVRILGELPFIEDLSAKILYSIMPTIAPVDWMNY